MSPYTLCEFCILLSSWMCMTPPTWHPPHTHTPPSVSIPFSWKESDSDCFSPVNTCTSPHVSLLFGADWWQSMGIRQVVSYVGFSEQLQLEKTLLWLYHSPTSCLAGNTAVLLVSCQDPVFHTSMYYVWFSTTSTLWTLAHHQQCSPAAMEPPGLTKTIRPWVVLSSSMSPGLDPAGCVLLSWLSILWSCLLYMPQTCTHDADRLLQEWHGWLKWLPRSGSYRIYPFVCEELTMVRLADGDIRANEVQLIASSLLRSSSLWCFSWSHTGALSMQQWASGQCRPGPKPWEHWWLCPSSPGPALSFTRSSCTHSQRAFVTPLYTAAIPTLDPLTTLWGTGKEFEEAGTKRWSLAAWEVLLRWRHRPGLRCKSWRKGSRRPYPENLVRMMQNQIHKLSGKSTSSWELSSLSLLPIWTDVFVTCRPSLDLMCRYDLLCPESLQLTLSSVSPLSSIDLGFAVLNWLICCINTQCAIY